MSIISSIMDSLKTRLGPLSATNGGPLAHLDVFGGDLKAFLDLFEKRSPGMVIVCSGSVPSTRGDARGDLRREYEVQIYVWDHNRRGYEARAEGFGPSNPGVWQIEDDAVRLLAGAQLAVEGCHGPLTDPTRIDSTGVAQIEELVSVWQMTLRITPPVMMIEDL
jgi:hypothetical protein